jgi:hypothetical protein
MVPRHRLITTDSRKVNQQMHSVNRRTDIGIRLDWISLSTRDTFNPPRGLEILLVKILLLGVKVHVIIFVT